MARALACYRDGLGFTVRHRWRPEGRLRWCWLDLDAASIMLQAYLKGKRPNGALGCSIIATPSRRAWSSEVRPL